jgi:hypothetical protein
MSKGGRSEHSVTYEYHSSSGRTDDAAIDGTGQLHDMRVSGVDVVDRLGDAHELLALRTLQFRRRHTQQRRRLWQRLSRLRPAKSLSSRLHQRWPSLGF